MSPVRNARRAEDGQGLQVSVNSDTPRCAQRPAPSAQNGGDLSGEEGGGCTSTTGRPQGNETPGEETSDKTGDPSRKPGLLRRLLGLGSR
jgi:hypothetical protein